MHTFEVTVCPAVILLLLLLLPISIIITVGQHTCSPAPLGCC
jgi:hypothetical protein